MRIEETFHVAPGNRKKKDKFFERIPDFRDQHTPTGSWNSEMLYKRVVQLLQHGQITAQSRQLARQTGPSFSGGALTDVTGRLPKTSYCGHSTVEPQH